MTIILKSPHDYPESLLLYGGGGAGKSSTVVNIAEHIEDGVTMHVLDCDHSQSYARAIAARREQETGIEERLAVHRIGPNWVAFRDKLREVMGTADPEKDWIVVDPMTGSYDWAQEYILDLVYGEDLVVLLAGLKKQYATDSRGYAAAVADLMNWQLVKKEYGKVWQMIHAWDGHLVMTAEAKPNPQKWGADTEGASIYGPIGYHPAGQASLKHASSTTLFCERHRADAWRMTTIKDRERGEGWDKEEVTDFGVDYLLGVAGWEYVGVR